MSSNSPFVHVLNRQIKGLGRLQYVLKNADTRGWGVKIFMRNTDEIHYHFILYSKGVHMFTKMCMHMFTFHIICIIGTHIKKNSFGINTKEQSNIT